MVRTWVELGKNMVRCYQAVSVELFGRFLGLFLPKFSPFGGGTKRVVLDENFDVTKGSRGGIKKRATR